MDRHLKEIDNEINAAYEMCIKAGYSHEEVQKFAKPILEPVVRERRKRQLFLLLKTLIKVSLVFAFILCLLYYIVSVDNEVNEKIGSGFRLLNRVFLMQVCCYVFKLFKFSYCLILLNHKMIIFVLLNDVLLI